MDGHAKKERKRQENREAGEVITFSSLAVLWSPNMTIHCGTPGEELGNFLQKIRNVQLTTHAWFSIFNGIMFCKKIRV